MTFEGLMEMASELGVGVGEGNVPFGFYMPHGTIFPDSPPVIVLPKVCGRVYKTETLAHELGHHILGHRRGTRPRILQEIEAWHQAKKLIAA